MTQFPLEPVNIIFGAPGEVTFDATDNHALLPVPDEIRNFASREDFLYFMRDELNAELYYSEEGELVSYRLTVMVLGNPVFWDFERGQFLDAPDAEAYFVAGRSGYYLEAGELRCHNLAICSRDSQWIFAQVALHDPALPDWDAQLFINEGTRSAGDDAPEEHVIFFQNELMSPEYGEALSMVRTARCEACNTYGCIDIPCPGALGEVWHLTVDVVAEWYGADPGQYGPMHRTDDTINSPRALVKHTQPNRGDFDLRCASVTSTFWMDSPLLGTTAPVVEWKPYHHPDVLPQNCGI